MTQEHVFAILSNKRLNKRAEWYSPWQRISPSLTESQGNMQGNKVGMGSPMGKVQPDTGAITTPQIGADKKDETPSEPKNDSFFQGNWGGKLVGGGIGALGLYGLSKLFGASGILALLATVVGAGIGGYFGHSYDTAIAKKQPAPKTPAPTVVK